MGNYVKEAGHPPLNSNNPDEENSGHVHAPAGELASENRTGKPSFDSEGAADQLTRDKLKWDGGEMGSSAEVTYSFLPGHATGDNGRQMTGDQIEASKAAMDIISSVANIDFKQAGRGAFSDDGDIGFQGMLGGGGFAQYMARPNGGETLEMMSARVSLGNDNLGLALHEIGHAVGLAHPGDYDGATRGYEVDAEYYQDSKQYTVMSYFGGRNTGAELGRFENNGSGTFEYKGGATGLGLHDIAALQKLYGANQTTHRGDTVYGFNSNTGDEGWTLDGKGDWINAAIWDTGGTDTIDMSGYDQNQEIDLRQEAFSSTGGMKYNLAIAKGAVIENAFGGSGNDVINGNEVANHLEGNAGADRLYGHGGNDRLESGRGNDTLVGGAGDDQLDGGAGRDTAQYSGRFSDYTIYALEGGGFEVEDKRGTDGTDTVIAVEGFLFADGRKSEADLQAVAKPASDRPDQPNPPVADVKPEQPEKVQPDTEKPADGQPKDTSEQTTKPADKEDTGVAPDKPDADPIVPTAVDPADPKEPLKPVEPDLPEDVVEPVGIVCPLPPDEPPEPTIKPVADGEDVKPAKPLPPEPLPADEKPADVKPQDIMPDEVTPKEVEPGVISPEDLDCGDLVNLLLTRLIENLNNPDGMGICPAGDQLSVPHSTNGMLEDVEDMALLGMFTPTMDAPFMPVGMQGEYEAPNHQSPHDHTVNHWQEETCGF